MSEHQLPQRTSQDPIYRLLAANQKAIANVLPKHLTPERMLRLSYETIRRTPKLRKCSSASIVNGIIEISMLGLDIGRNAHLVPFKDTAVVILDYKGMIELAHRSGQINSVPFNPVYENDYFEYQEGTDRYIKHKPTPQNRGKLIAAYAIANFKHGGFDFVVVHPVDIEAVKRVAPGANFKDSPWNNPDQEWTMWCKTAVRRLAKRIPQSPELSRAIELEDLVEAGIAQPISHIEGTVDMEIEADPAETKTVKPKTLEEIQSETQDKINELKKNGSVEPEPQSWVCPECGFEAKSQKGLSRHMTITHKKKEQVLCEMCGEANPLVDGHVCRPCYEEVKAQEFREETGEPEPMDPVTFMSQVSEYEDGNPMLTEQIGKILWSFGYRDKANVKNPKDMVAILSNIRALVGGG